MKNRHYIHTYILFLLSIFTLASLTTSLFIPRSALAQTCPPALLGSYDTPGCRACHVYVSGSTAYVADGDRGLQIIDISNPLEPVLFSNFDAPGEEQDVYVSGNLAYLANRDSGLQIIDVSNPAAPALLGSYDTPKEAKGVYVSGGTAYVTDARLDESVSPPWIDGSLQIIDVSNPGAPVWLGSYDTSGAAESVYVSDSTAYVADGNNGLQIIDVSNLGVPVWLGNYDTPTYAEGVYVSGSTAYVADHGSLQIIDVSNPAAPTLLGSYDTWAITPGTAFGVYVSGKTAYVAAHGSLQIIDASNPAAPALLGSYDTPGIAQDVYVSGSTAYVADGVDGLQIIDVSGCGVEDCTNEIDDDEDGLVDCDDPDCTGDPACVLCQCAADSGCISGQATSRRTGLPKANKRVKLKRGRKTIKRIRTGSDGCYDFTNVADGTYKVKVMCRGKRPRRQIVIISGGVNQNEMDFTCKK